MTATVDIARVTDLIAPAAKMLGLDIVRVGFFVIDGDETLQVMAERPATRQLIIDDCVALSRAISDILDPLEGAPDDPIPVPYRLEVSSPGIDRPLTRLADFADWAGHEAKAAMVEGAAIDGRKSFHGILTGVDGDAILFDDRKSGPVRLPFAAIASAKLLLTDRLIAATVPLSTEGADEVVTIADPADADADPAGNGPAADDAAQFIDPAQD